LLRFRSWILLAVVAVGAPLFFPLLVRTSEVPGVIRGMYEPDQITVLEFFDFQCPHCQHLSPRLGELVAEEGGFTLKYGYTPLPAHPESRGAARRAICAAEQGKEKELVHRFFEVLDFSEAAVSKMTIEIVPDQERFLGCLASDRPDRRIESDTQNLKAAGFEGLPTTYVGGIRILGAEDDAVYQDAFRRVREGKDTSGLNPRIYWGGILLLLVAIVLMGRGRDGARKISGSSP
jgi:predicted DsbA family dithiol-disulfide isomerase